VIVMGVQESPVCGKVGEAEDEDQLGFTKVGWARLIVPVPAWQNMVVSKGATHGVNPVCAVRTTRVAPDGSSAMLPS
jgi:hypothetical protein